ncbi:unnamed protein product [Mucor fragilis]
MGALKRQFRFRLKSEINKCHEDKKKDFYGLLKRLVAAKRLPKGVVADTEASIKATGQPIQSFLSSNYRQKNLKTVDLWADYVKKNFDEIKESLLKDDDNDDEEESDDDEEAEESEEEEEYEDIQQRTCSTSLLPIIRKDLPPAVRQAFVGTINTTMIQVSNYVADFSKQVLKIALLFNDYGFAKQNRKAALVPQKGNSLDPVLPVGYLDYIARVPKPVDADCLKDADFSSEYSQLFQLPHLELIHSSYFGAVGVQESSLKAFPLHKEILQVLPAYGHNPYESLSSHAMKIARQLYETNFQNMWADNTIVNKLLTRLLRFLLMCHLCPDQDHDFKAKKKDLQSKRKGKGKQVLRDTNTSIPVESISLINKTRNGRRRLFRKEQQKKQKYESKGNTRAVERCQVRLDTYREALAREQPVESNDVEEQLVQDEIKVEKSQDISKRRLGKLVQVARSALFSKDAISPACITKKFKKANEKDVISRIVVFVKP